MSKFPVGIIPLLAIIVVWEIASRLHLYSQALLPSPEEVVRVFIEQPRDLAMAVGSSMVRVFVGVSLAALTAIPIGLVLGRNHRLYRVMDWTIQIFRCLPMIALIPLAIVFFGIGNKPAIILIWLAAFWPLLINTIFGVNNVERTLLRVAHSAQASEGMILREILLPGALPTILTGLRLAIGSGWLTVVTSEMIAVRSGIGYLIIYAETVFHADQVVAGIIMIGAVGLAFDVSVRALRHRLCRWQEGLVLSS